VLGADSLAQQTAIPLSRAEFAASAAAMRSLPLLDEPLTGVPRDEGADNRRYKHIWHRRRNDAP
jgi:hypothetical protein